MTATFEYEILVVGGGHAGVEAALVGARRGHSVGLLTIRREDVGAMSCNPAIGGSAKGQVVREIDALGGEMAQVIDATGIQFRMLNLSKGPAVWAPRAQADRELYRQETLRRVESQPNLRLHEELVEELIVENGQIVGVATESLAFFRSETVIIAAGTFLRGLIHIGEERFPGGRIGERHAEKLSISLQGLGFRHGRMKTGTPPRVRKGSIDFSQMEVQKGDVPPPRFSFSTVQITQPQICCYTSYTNETTHRILLDNLHRTAMYAGRTQAVGARYCPSVEDKVVRFRDKPKHQIILEPEGLDNDLMYVNGFSTSMPKEIQDRAIRTIPGYANAEIIRYGYAIEYDFIPPIQLTPGLETRVVKNLFLCGQINGTSGYEEAAGQGIVAGINAVQRLRGEDFFIPDRSESYIGVMIDDLVTKNIDEPYRLFTSRAEYRLRLRQDNADLRLTRYGHDYGLINDERYEALQMKEAEIGRVRNQLDHITVSPESVNPVLSELESSHLRSKCALSDVARRPEVGMSGVKRMGYFCNLSEDVEFQVNLALKYEGYIARQDQEIGRYRQLEQKRIPDGFDYDQVKGLSTEGRMKMKAIQPASIGQAGRISGVTPADISVLLISLKNRKRKMIRNN
ncbi:MAG: tRNA uridine-5-carboxymethylaminomethyl(34) synthesis enzyme MnmG [Candidatus Cloacimonetes bacterium 4572_55]|nr:MAG: tRNA uridine-5-carboxymethylaminomethyl(34) synthesis enzyme MnmG [Candidatus Cloacimonetes bacterium 4572_55]